MSKDTQFNHMQRSIDNVKDCFQSIKAFRLSHAKHLDYIDERIYTSNSYQRLSRWRKAYVDGYIQAQRDNMYKEFVYMGYLRGEWVDMKEIDNHKNFPGWQKYAEFIKRAENWGLKPTGHFWKEIKPYDNQIPKRWY